MKARNVFWNLITAVLLSSGAGLASVNQAGVATGAIESRTADVDGLKVHYLKAGQGPAVLLLHGYAETSRMWRPIIPRLAQSSTVIAPDLPGIGDSAIPANGIDITRAADLIHALARSLGIANAKVVGHDIGLMVAYGYAARFPTEVTKLALMDAFLPGVEGWEAIYDNPGFWHFRFHGPTPAALVRGRERTYFEHYWNDFAANRDRSLSEADRAAYTAAYSRPGRMEAGWAYFASFPKTAEAFARLSQTRLTMPLLSIGGEKSLGKQLGEQARLVGTNVTVVVLPNAGHWILEEQHEATTDALLKFLAARS
jgi:pimeloyl-ACP methyl ester carboxylesterase